MQDAPVDSKPMNCECLLLGVTGSVGAFIVPEYVAKLRTHFAANIHVIMTRSAQKFVMPYVLELFSGNPVFTGSFAMADDIRVPHIDLAQKASLFLIMPATANILGKAASGVCDDLLSTTIVACQAPVVFVPNMNEAMWTDRIVQRNVSALKDAGYYVIEPSRGFEVANWVPNVGGMPPFERLLVSLELVLGVRPEISDGE